MNWASVLLAFLVVTPAYFLVRWAVERHRPQLGDFWNAILFGLIFTASIAALRAWDGARTGTKNTVVKRKRQ